MSRTYRKYPSGHYRANGENYERWNDVPEKKKYLKEYKNVTTHKLERVHHTKINRWGKPIVYLKMELVPHVERVETGTWRSYNTYGDAEWIEDYNKKTPDGDPKRETFGMRGVGKEWKHIRSQKHRAEAKHVIAQWNQGNFNMEIPVEKNHDRWDCW